MSIQYLISTYGYLAIFIGTFFEGETILVIGGFSAHRGYLELAWVIVSAFFGALLGDQLYFILGRKKGKSLFAKKPHWAKKSEKVFSLLEKHQTIFILGYRFLYGLRTVSPFLIGMSGVTVVRFITLNIIGVGIWAATIGTAGFLFGQALESALGNIKRFELHVIVLLAGIGLLLWLYQFIKRRFNTK